MPSSWLANIARSDQRHSQRTENNRWCRGAMIITHYFKCYCSPSGRRAMRERCTLRRIDRRERLNTIAKLANREKHWNIKSETRKFQFWLLCFLFVMTITWAPTLARIIVDNNMIWSWKTNFGRTQMACWCDTRWNDIKSIWRTIELSFPWSPFPLLRRVQFSFHFPAEQS